LLGGQLGTDPLFSEKINKKNVIPADRIHLSLKALIDTWQAERQGDEKFPKWVHRTEPERLLKIALDAALSPDAVPLTA
jgi:sulfite reductase beta subunit-like hemoprotein